MVKCFKFQGMSGFIRVVFYAIFEPSTGAENEKTYMFNIAVSDFIMPLFHATLHRVSLILFSWPDKTLESIGNMMHYIHCILVCGVVWASGIF